MRLIDADELKKKSTIGENMKGGRCLNVSLDDIERQVTADLYEAGKISEKLGMTLQQMETEIMFMREFDKYMQENHAEQYMNYIMAFNKIKVTEELVMLGADEKEIKEICDYVEKDMREEYAEKKLLSGTDS